MKNVRAALLVTCVAWASPAVAAPPLLPYDVNNIVKQSYYRDLRRPPLSYFAAAERAGAPGSEFYRMENAENISASTAHARNGNSALGPPGGQHSYLFLAVEGYATGQPGISSDGREGALAYANLTDASGTKPNTFMYYGFSVYLPSELYSYGDNYPPWAAAQPLYDDRFFKLTSTSLPWVPVLEISANRLHRFTITYRGGKFNIGPFSSASSDPMSTSDPSSVTTPTPDLCAQDPAPLYEHHRVAMAEGQATAVTPDTGQSTTNVWHDFVVFYKSSSSGADGQIIVWHRTAGAASGWQEWLRRDAPKIRTAFNESVATIVSGVAPAWGYERPSYCYGNGEIVPGCASGSGNTCEIADFSAHQANGGLYLDNIVVASTETAAKAAFPSSDTGF